MRSAKIIALLLLGGVSACATIPKEAATLSAELGSRIQQSREAHEETVRIVMVERRARVDSFLVNEWLPYFSDTLLRIPEVANAMQAAMSGDRRTQLEFFVELGTRVQARLSRKRLELMRPLDDAERGIIRQLEEHYNQMLAVNSSLTALLASGAEVTENRERLTRMLDPQGRLPGYLDKVDDIVNIIVEKRDAIVNRRAAIDSLLNAIRSQ